MGDTLSSLSISELVLDSSDVSGQTLLAGVGLTSSLARIGSARGGLFRSTDGGANFTRLTSPIGDNNVVGLGARGAFLHVATTNQLWCSNSGGLAFTSLSVSDGTEFGLPAGTIADFAGDSSDAYVAVTQVSQGGSVGIYRSTGSNGLIWNRVTSLRPDIAAALVLASKVEVTARGNVVALAVVGIDDRLATTAACIGAAARPLVPETGFRSTAIYKPQRCTALHSTRYPRWCLADCKTTARIGKPPPTAQPLKPCCKATFVEPSGEVFELTDSERLPNLSSARQFRSVDGRHLLVSKPMADPLNASIFCVYGVLLLLYNNALHPITILMAVPLSAGGAFGALPATNNTLSLPALIGLLMLIGIATKNSILLVDYAEMAEHEQGMSRFDAVIDACKKRVQPVLMTTIAMIAGMMPIALGLGADASFRAPMAVAVIGGLITSTLLSLVVIPAAYTVIDDVSRRFKGRNVVAHKV